MSTRRMARSRGGGARRRTVWAEFDAHVPFTANGTWITLDLLAPWKASSGNTVAKATVLRTHGYIVPTTALAAGNRLWTGLKVSDTNDVLAAPGTNAMVANPRDNPYAAWAFFSRHTVDGNVFAITPSSIGAPSNDGMGITYDLKSKRKLENIAETWSVSILNETLGATAQVDVFFRTLLALP